MLQKYRVIIKVKPRPRPHETSAAEHVANFLRTNVEFIQTGSSKTPDLLIQNQFWEIKSPTGSSPKTVMHQFQKAEKQAKFMIFDARRIKINHIKCLHQVQTEFRKSKTIKRVIFISKDAIVIELQKTG